MLALMRSAWFLIGAVFVLGAAAAPVYKWVDEDGNVVYSDRPQPGAEQLEDPQVQTVPAPPLPPQRPEPPAPPQAREYRSIAIASPEDDATLRDNTGNVQVQVTLRPPLQVNFGHSLQLYLDGQPHGEPGRATSFTLANVPRGTHTLRAAVLDEDGREVAGSAASVFHLHRTFIRRDGNN